MRAQNEKPEGAKRPSRHAGMSAANVIDISVTCAIPFIFYQDNYKKKDISNVLEKKYIDLFFCRNVINFGAVP